MISESDRATPDHVLSRPDFPLLRVSALAFVVCTAFSSQMVMPLWIGAVIDDYDLSRSVAGAIASVEMAVVAVVTVAMSFRLHLFKVRPTVVAGLTCLIVGNLLAALMRDPIALAAARVVVGCGKAMVVTISFGVAASHPRPLHAFVAINASYTLFSAFLFLALPPVIAAGGAPRCLMVLAAVPVFGALAMAWYPERNVLRTSVADASRQAIHTSGLVAFVALITLNIGLFALWTFMERIGLNLKLTPAKVGQVLSLASFLTIAGPVMARVVDTRFGYIPPQLAGLAVLSLVTLLLVYATKQWTYPLLVPAFLVTFGFTAPFVLGFLSKVDLSSRLPAAAPAGTALGGSLGSLLGGWTADRLGFLGLGWTVSGFFLMAIMMLILAGRLSGRVDTGPLRMN